MTSIAGIWLKLLNYNLRSTNSDKHSFDALGLLTSILSKYNIFITSINIHLRKFMKLILRKITLITIVMVGISTVLFKGNSLSELNLILIYFSS